MVKSNFFADPTADTFHGVKIARGMRISYSASENTKMRAHIIRHQLTKASPDFYLAELHKTLGIAGLGQKYIDVIYPKVANAVKSRIEELSNQKGCNEMLDGVKDGDQTRFYPPSLDAWALPDWQGDLAMPDADADEQGRDDGPRQQQQQQQQQQDIPAGKPRQEVVDLTSQPPSPPPESLPPQSLRINKLLPPAVVQQSESRPHRAVPESGPGLLRSPAPGPIRSHRPAQMDRDMIFSHAASGDITPPPIRNRVLPSQHRLGGQLQSSSFHLRLAPDDDNDASQSIIITRSPPRRQTRPVDPLTPPATVVKPRRNRMSSPPDDDDIEQPLPPRYNDESNPLSRYRTMLEKLMELHLKLRQVQGDETMALWRGRQAELRVLEDQIDDLRQRAAPLREGLGLVTRKMARGAPGALGCSHVLGATVDLLLLGLNP